MGCDRTVKLNRPPGFKRMRALHAERHRTDRIGWLRAAVLGANDGIVSTASLVVGVAAAHSKAGGQRGRAGAAGVLPPGPGIAPAVQAPLRYAPWAL